MNCFQPYVFAQCESARTACILSSARLYLPVARRGEKAPFCSVRVADFLTFRQEYALRQEQAARLLCAERRSAKRGGLFLLHIGRCRFYFISDIQRRVPIPFCVTSTADFPRFCRADAQKQTAPPNAFFAFPIRKISPNWRHNGTKHSFAEYYYKHNIIKTR